MKIIIHALIGTVCAIFSGLSHGSSQIDQDILGTWQFDLTKNVRYMDVREAYRTGVTRALLTFKSDKTVRMEPPCRDDEFIKMLGVSALTGTWEIKDKTVLVLTFRHRNETMVKTYAINFVEDEMTFTAGSEKPRRLGRFTGDTTLSCQ